MGPITNNNELGIRRTELRHGPSYKQLGIRGSEQRQQPSYKQLEVKTKLTNTNNVNKTTALLQTTGGKDETNKHK
jgi:hypothetical protein